MAINFKNLQQINSQLRGIKDIEFLIVTKKRTIEDIKILISLGHKCFGENRVQEAEKKFETRLIENNNLKLHLIGPLQTNKVNQALNLFHTIQSVDRPKLAECISQQINKNKILKTKNFYIQVNIGKEEQKSGIDPSELKDFYQYCIELELNIIGLMCIPPDVIDPSKYFLEMENLKKKINVNLLLSMGMSNDYKIALKHNTNLIRIGSRIFV